MQLTTRDKVLFHLLCRHNLLSTKQIQTRVFANLDLSTVMRRLRKLQAGGFIVRLGMLPCRTFAWGCSQLSNELFSGFTSASRANLHTLNHDVQLSELRFLFEDMTRVDDWYDIRHIARDAMPPPYAAEYHSGSYNFRKGGAALVPDALFLGWNDDKPFTCVLELELSIKNGCRYRKIFGGYSYRKQPAMVLYVVENDSIRHAIESNVANDVCSKRLFFTVRRQDLFRSRENAVLQNARDKKLIRFFEIFDCKARKDVHEPAQEVGKLLGNPLNSVKERQLTN